MASHRKLDATTVIGICDGHPANGRAAPVSIGRRYNLREGVANTLTKDRYMDTSAARRNIIARLRVARLRAAQRRPPLPAAAEREALTDYLARRSAGPRPDLPGDLVELFAVQSRKRATSVACVDGPQQVPAAVAAYLHEHKLAKAPVAWVRARWLRMDGCRLPARIQNAARRPLDRHPSAFARWPRPVC